MDELGQNQKGFTLIELVVVLIIIGIISGVVATRWPGNLVDLAGHARQLARDIQLTQMLAMDRGQRFRINFTSNSYHISDRTDSTSYTHPAVGQTEIPLPPSITLSAPQSYIVFNGIGAPFVDDTLPGTPLASSFTITLATTEASRDIIINAQTGRVAIQ